MRLQHRCYQGDFGSRIKLNTLKSRVRKQRSAPRDDTAEDSELLQQVSQCLPEAPAEVDLVIPKNYRVRDTGIYLLGKGRNGAVQTEQIAKFPVIITKRFLNADAGDESLELAWLRGGWHRQIVSRATAMNATKLIELNGRGFPVDSNNAKIIIAYLTAFEQANFSKLPLDYVTHHLGWQGKNGARGFLIGHELITASGAIAPDSDIEHRLHFQGLASGDEQIAAGFHRRGTLSGWIEGVAPIADYPKALTILYAAFVPPLLAILGCGNFTVDISARTTTGKSTAQSIAASICGNPDLHSPDPVVHSWNDTRNHFDRLCGVSKDLPIFLDDTKAAKKEDDVEKAVYDFAAGQGKGRANIKGLERSEQWSSVLLSSGESPITSFGKSSGGAHARALVLTGYPFGSDKVAKLVNDFHTAVRRNYGYALPVFIEWVLKHKNEWDSWLEEYNAECDRLAACEGAQDSIAGRLANFMAAVTYTAKLVQRAFEDNGHPLRWEYTDDLLAGVWSELVRGTEDAPVETRALRDVFSWAQQNESKFLHGDDLRDRFEPSVGWFGKWLSNDDWDRIAFFPDQLTRFLESRNYKPEEVINGWKQKGWLKLDKDGTRPTAGEYIGPKKSAKMNVVWRRALIEVGSMDE